MPSSRSECRPSAPAEKRSVDVGSANRPDDKGILDTGVDVDVDVDIDVDVVEAGLFSVDFVAAVDLSGGPPRGVIWRCEVSSGASPTSAAAAAFDGVKPVRQGGSLHVSITPRGLLQQRWQVAAVAAIAKAVSSCSSPSFFPASSSGSWK